MTNQQRIEEFKRLLAQAEERTGVTLRPRIITYADGSQRPDLELALIADWQPAEQAEE